MFIKKENKILFKYFILVFSISALMINWQKISWMFNYKEISGMASDFFQKEISVDNEKISISLTDVRADRFEFSEKNNQIEIPKISISVPLVFPRESEKTNLERFLDKGAILFPESSLPGSAGETIVLGHSAPPGWPKIKHDWIFTRISELNKGDKIIIYYNHRKYGYTVFDKFILDKGQKVPNSLKNSQNALVLLSCWPPGKNYKRMAIRATLDKF